MKSQEELVAKIKAESGMFSFIPEVLIEYLDFDNAMQFLDDEWKGKREEWEMKSQGREAIIQDMREYMDFAWGEVHQPSRHLCWPIRRQDEGMALAPW